MLNEKAKLRLAKIEREVSNPRRGGDYLTQAEAIARLGIKAATLYTYVSRGWVRRVPHPRRHCSLYLRDDVEKVKARSDARMGHGVVAADAMRWGEPVFATSITEITSHGPRYRNRLAIELAEQHAPFENVAELLWSGVWIDEPVRWPGGEPLDVEDGVAALSKLRAGMHINQVFSFVTLAHGVHEGSRLDRIGHGSTPVTSTRRLIRALAGSFAFLYGERSPVSREDGESIAAVLARILARTRDPDTIAALDAALVLCADHELNPSTFAARVAASSGADLHSCMSAALGTHSGTLIGRACDKVEDLLEGMQRESAIRPKLGKIMQAGRKLPGFNHPLYPGGDPRAVACVQLAQAVGRPNGRLAIALRMLDVAATEFEAKPSIETGLVVLCDALRLPPRVAGGLFALGRAAGWSAHILEQRLAGYILRPRARFVRRG